MCLSAVLNLLFSNPDPALKTKIFSLVSAWFREDMLCINLVELEIWIENLFPEAIPYFSEACLYCRKNALTLLEEAHSFQTFDDSFGETDETIPSLILVSMFSSARKMDHAERDISVWASFLG